jgi:hypothetical protein
MQVLGVSIVVAKVWNDNPVYNADFQTVLPQLTRNELLELERVVLELLKWDVELSPADYGVRVWVGGCPPADFNLSVNIALCCPCRSLRRAGCGLLPTWIPGSANNPSHCIHFDEWQPATTLRSVTDARRSQRRRGTAHNHWS